MSFIQDDNDALKQKVIATLERTGLRSAVNAIYGKYPSKIGLDIDPAQSDKILSALRKDFSKVVYNSDEFEVVIGDGALVSDGFELPTKGERFVYSVSYGNINVEFDGSKYIVDGHILVSKEDLLKMLEETGGKLIKKVRDSVDVDVEDADDLWAVGFDIDGGFSQSNLVRAGSAAEAERKLTEAKKKRYPNSVIKVYGATKHTGSIKPGYPIIDSNEGFEDDDDELLVHDGHDTELKLLPVLEGVVRKWEAWKSKYKTLFELEDKYWRSWDGYRTSLQKEEPEKYKRLTDMLVKANHEVEPIIREWNRIAESVSRGRDGRSNFNVKLEPETFPASHLFRLDLRLIFNKIKHKVETNRRDSVPVSDARIINKSQLKPGMRIRWAYGGELFEGTVKEVDDRGSYVSVNYTDKRGVGASFAFENEQITLLDSAVHDDYPEHTLETAITKVKTQDAGALPSSVWQHGSVYVNDSSEITSQKIVSDIRSYMRSAGFAVRKIEDGKVNKLTISLSVSVVPSGKKGNAASFTFDLTYVPTSSYEYKYKSKDVSYKQIETQLRKFTNSKLYEDKSLGDAIVTADAKIEYVFNWRDTYHKTQQKTAILANNIGEAIRKFADYVALAGVGTANAYVMSISPNDGWVALYGTAHELKKKMGDSMPVADKLVEIPQAILNRIESIAASRGYKVAAKGKTLFGREHYEFVPLNPVTDIQMRAFVDEVDSYARSKNVPATFSANVVKVVFDFDKIYVKDSAVADEVSYDTLLANWGFAFIKGNGRTETWYYRDDDDEGFKRALRNIREVRPNLVASSTNDGTRQITIVKDSRKMFKVTDSSGKIYLVKANDEMSALSRLADIKAVKDYSPEVRNFISKLEVIGLRFERDLGEDVIRFANPKKVSIDLIRKNIPSGSTVFERDGYVVVNF